MKSISKRFFTLFLGYFFIALGVAGLMLPIVQGIPFLILGLFMLSHEAPWAKRLLNKFRAKYPGLFEKITSAKAKLLKFLNIKNI